MKVTGVEEIVDPQVMNITVNEEKCCEVTQVDILEGTEVEKKSYGGDSSYWVGGEENCHGEGGESCGVEG